jgi:hypothetical protein
LIPKANSSTSEIKGACASYLEVPKQNGLLEHIMIKLLTMSFKLDGLKSYISWNVISKKSRTKFRRAISTWSEGCSGMRKETNSSRKAVKTGFRVKQAGCLVFCFWCRGKYNNNKLSCRF